MTYIVPGQHSVRTHIIRPPQLNGLGVGLNGEVVSVPLAVPVPHQPRDAVLQTHLAV